VGAGEADPGALEDVSKEDLVARLKSQEKRYDDLRSLHDRQMNQLRDQQKEQFEILKQLAAQKTAQPEAPAQEVDDGAFVEEWAEKISPDDPEKGKATIAFMRGVMGDALARMERQNAELRQQLEGKLTKQDPDYKRHQKVVDELVAEGMPFEKAIGFAKKYGKGAAAAQPGTAVPPGRVATGSRAVGATSNGAVEIDPMTANMMRMVAGSLGHKDAAKFIDGIARQVAEERARG
jgi:hypothetical protein